MNSILESNKMLSNLKPHNDYQAAFRLKLIYHIQMQGERLVKLGKTTSNLHSLNIDNLFSVIKPLYPVLVRPAKNQQGIIDTFFAPSPCSHCDFLVLL